MFTTCEIKQQPAQPVLSIRARTAVQNLPVLIGQTCERVIQHLQGLGEAPSGDLFVTYYNMDMQDLDVEIGFTLSKSLPGAGDIQAGTIPAGKVATCVYTGPYEKMIPAYEALNDCIKENGLEPTGTSYEYYLNGPPETPPEAFQTRIVLPIKATA
jgi:effector-binding domain-containing protein